MAKEVIAVDVDEVLFPLMPTLIEFHNLNYGTTFEFDHMTSYHLQDLTGETEEQILVKFSEYLKTEHYTKGQPVKGALEAIKQLRETYSLVLITARQSIYRGATEQFINKHFGGLFDELRYTHTLEQPDVRLSKLKICKELRAKTLIDDGLHNITEVASGGVQGVLFGSYPWNQIETLPKGVIRCNHWADVLEYLDAKG